MITKAQSVKSKATALHVVENIPSHNTVQALEHLTELARRGECLGIAFAAILTGNRCAKGFTDAAIEQHYTAIGILTEVISDLSPSREEGRHEI